MYRSSGGHLVFSFKVSPLMGGWGVLRNFSSGKVLLTPWKTFRAYTPGSAEFCYTILNLTPQIPPYTRVAL